MRSVKAAAFYAAVALTILGALVTSLRLWRKPLGVPLFYLGDGVFWTVMVKAVSEDGIAGHFRRLGMPFGVDVVDWGNGMPLDFTILAILARVSGQPGAAVNLYWVGSVAATGVTAAFALRCLDFSRPLAYWLAVVYALIPYAFFRNVQHLPLVFHFVPLIALLGLRLATGRTDEMGRGERAAVLGGCLLQGLSFIYYSFFACLLLPTAWLGGAWRSRRRAGLGLAIAAVAALVAGTGLGLAPSLRYWATHGPNAELAYKRVDEADRYGLKIRHLLTPIPDHPLAPFRALSATARGAGYPLENENAWGMLGATGSLGLLGLLAVSILGRSAARRPVPLLEAAASLNLLTLLLATVGGFGSIFNLLVRPDIRCYNRAVVFIAFFSLVGLGTLARQAAGRLLGGRTLPRSAAVLGSVALTLLAVSDQASTRGLVSRYQADGERFATEAAFVAEIESLLPAGAMVFQLPHTNMPTDSGRLRMATYDHGRPFLHSRALGWSWGGWNGRNGNWNRGTAELPLEQLVERIVIAGFSGIWIDRFGYPDEARELEERLRRIAGGPLRSSAGGRYAFVGLEKLREALRARASASALDALRARVLSPIVLRVESCRTEERSGGQRWRWCDGAARLVIENPAELERRVRLAGRLITASPEGRSLDVVGEGFSETVLVTSRTTPYERELVLRPNQRLTIDLALRDVGAGPSAAAARPLLGLLDLALVESVPGAPATLEVR
jgi:phosphoglycerol transferase